MQTTRLFTMNFIPNMVDTNDKPVAGTGFDFVCNLVNAGKNAGMEISKQKEPICKNPTG